MRSAPTSTVPRPHRPMTTSDLVAAIRPVVEAFSALGVRHYLGGSVASSAHGIARASLDADIVAELGPEHVSPLIERLSADYYIPEERLRFAATSRSSCNFIHLATMFKIDVFVSQRRPFDLQAAGRAQPQPLDEASGTPLFFVASAEDTVLAKLEWFRMGGETSERQWWDIVGVLRVANQTDRGYLRDWARVLQVEDLLDRALAGADRDPA
jgi:hypothetical protein